MKDDMIRRGTSALSLLWDWRRFILGAREDLFLLWEARVPREGGMGGAGHGTPDTRRHGVLEALPPGDQLAGEDAPPPPRLAEHLGVEALHRLVAAR